MRASTSFVILGAVYDRLRQRLLVPALVRAAGLERAVGRAQRGIGKVVAAIARAGLDERGHAELSARLYDRNAGGRHREMFPWEARWLEELPPPPARALVGGAGYGAECRWLRDRGYAVDAYDPSRRGIERCRSIVGPDGLAIVATHQEVASATQTGRGVALALASRRYDFVWLGWGSLSHVLERPARRDVMRAIATLTDGPILASCRPWTAGFDQDPVRYQWQVGFAVAIPEDELSGLAVDLGRALSLERNPGVITFRLGPTRT